MDIGSERASWETLLDAEIREQAAHNERYIARAALVVAGAASLAAVYMLLAVHTQLGWMLVGLAAAFAAWVGLILPRLLNNRAWLPTLQRVNVTLEVSVAGLIALVDLSQLGGAYAFTSTPVFFVFIAVSASGLRLRWSLVAYAGLLGAIEQFGLWWLCQQDISAAEIAALPSLGIGHAVQRSLYIVMAALVAGVVAQEGRRIARRVVTQHADKQRLRQLFGEYVSEQVVEKVLQGDLNLGGERRVVTVLFADIRGFTAMSSAVSPEAVVDYLNRYFDTTCQVISRHGGLINKFIGDGLLAVFGAPEDDPQHARHALDAARELAELVGDVSRPDGGPTRVGVGLHCGELVLGSIGTAQHRDYTVIGDTVNLASRIEGLTAELGESVLFSSAVCQAAGVESESRKLGEFEVKGREQPVELYTFSS